MINIVKVIVQSPLNINKDAQVKGFKFTEKGLIAHLEMKGYKVVKSDHNESIFEYMGSIGKDIQIRQLENTISGFLTGEDKFLSTKEFLANKGTRVTSSIPNFGMLLKEVKTQSGNLSLEYIDSKYIDYQYSLDKSQSQERTVMSDKVIEVEIDGRVLLVPIPVIITTPKMVLNKKYISDKDYAISLLKEIKSDIVKDMEKTKINITKEDMDKYGTKDESLVLVYKMILDKEV